MKRENEKRIDTYACDTSKIDWILESGCSGQLINDDLLLLVSDSE